MASTANSSKSGKPVNAAKATKAAKAVPKPAAPKPTVRRAAPKAAKLPDDLSGRAAHSTLAATPLIGIRSADMKRAAGIFAGAMLKQPRKVASHLGSYARELGRVAAGTSEARGDPRTAALPTRPGRAAPCTSACCRSILLPAKA